MHFFTFLCPVNSVPWDTSKLRTLQVGGKDNVISLGICGSLIYVLMYVRTRAETICQLVILHIAIATSNIAIYCIIVIIYFLV